MTIVATGPAGIAAYRARIQHGHHDNTMLIDRVIHQSNYDLACVASRAFVEAQRIGDMCRAALSDEQRL